MVRARLVSFSFLAAAVVGLGVTAVPAPAAGIGIEDNCAVRSMRGVELASSELDGLDAVTLDPRGGIVVSSLGDEDLPGLGRRTIMRFTPDGTIDTSFGTAGVVDLGLMPGIPPRIAVSSDGTIWTTGFLSDNRPGISIYEINPNGQTVEEHRFDYPGQFVAGSGALDATGPVTLSIVVRDNAGDPGQLEVINVETGEVIRQAANIDGFDARSVSASGVTVVEGNEVILHDPGEAAIPIAVGSGEPQINTAFRTSDAFVYAGSLLERETETSLFETFSPLIGRQRTDGVAGPGELVGFIRLPDGNTVVDLSSDGIVVIEDQRPSILIGGPGSRYGIWLAAVDPFTGEYQLLAHAEEARTVDDNRPSDLVEMANGEKWVVSTQESTSVFLAQLWADAPKRPEAGALADQVARLYRAYFERAPDSSGQRFWEDQRIDGRTLASVSDAFAQSPEFISEYGRLDDPAFVELVYRNVLGRSPDNSGLQFWLNELASGLDRGSVMIGFSESAEFVNATATVAPATDDEGQIARLYQAFFERDPDADGFCFWTGQMEMTGLDGVSQAFVDSREFVETYGALADDAFVDLVYRNVLGRPAEETGRAFWIDRLASGLDRGSLMIGFSESPEFIRRTGTPPPN